jgi:trypsin
LHTPRVFRLVLAAALALVAGVVGFGQANADGQDAQIVGGTRASIADHSYAVYLATPEGFQFCGGSIVAPDRVLTAAHCVAGKQPTGILVIAGREDKDSGAGVKAAVTSIWTHPRFTEVRAGYDVAVLTLDKELPYEAIELVSAKEVEAYQAGTPGLILGWGRLADGGESSRYLMQATVPVLADDSCTASYPAYLAAAMTCAGYPEGGVDSCQGDSGGPFVIDGKLAGITSWGEGCAAAGKPGVYTRLAAYVDEIAEQI